ncbi:MAG: siderophore-interacting protein [Pseudomonadota bacterium]
MAIKKEYTLTASAELHDLAFSAIRSISLYEAKEHDLDILVDTESNLVVDTIYGAYEFIQLNSGVRVSIHSNAENSVFVLKDAFVQNLAHFSPGSMPTIQWSDQKNVGQFPPNFQFTTVESVKRVGRRFIRVCLSVPDLSEYTDHSIHFRLVLPALNATDIEWPTVKANGSVGWPEGDKLLHRPVYTARSVNTDNGTFDLDVFLHEGGRVTQWVQNLKVGGQVAIIGPGGGGVPDTKEIHLFADETAYPAVARISETLDRNATGSLTLLTDRNHVGDYDFNVPSSFSIKWVTRDNKGNFNTLTNEIIDNIGDAYFWYAGEKQDVIATKKLANDKGVKKENRYIGSYWSKE